MKVCARDQIALAKHAKGRDYRSDAEVKHALDLLGDLRAGRIKDFEFEKTWELKACDCSGFSNVFKHIGDHKVDFTVWYKDGRIEVHEVKAGQITKTDGWQLRRKLFEANYPHIRYRLYEFGTERRKWFIQLEDE